LRLYFENEGFRLLHAESDEIGLDRLPEHDPRVVLLDIGLPGIDGIEVCRRIRATSDVPVIMLTARDSEIDTMVGLEIGADDYVTKPIFRSRAGGPSQGRPPAERGTSDIATGDRSSRVSHRRRTA
jgi:DNA-binding response OmpR family regulator